LTFLSESQTDPLHHPRQPLTFSTKKNLREDKMDVGSKAVPWGKQRESALPRQSIADLSPKRKIPFFKGGRRVLLYEF